MNKKIILIIILGITLILCGCNVGSKSPPSEDLFNELEYFDDYSGYGRLYTLKEAYELSYINHETLLSIAYYQNKGIVRNELLMSSTYEPIEPDEKTISKDIINKIRATYSSNQVEFEACSVYDIFGSYNDVIVCKIESSLESIPTVELYETIDDVNFIYPNYKISVWIENKGD